MVAMNVWPTDAADGSVSSEARWRKMGREWAATGVAVGVGGNMNPTLAYPNLTVKAGAAWVDGHFCELPGDQVLAVTPNGLCVVRFDPAANSAQLLYLDGVTVPAQSPTGTFEIPIAKITGSALSDVRRPHTTNVFDTPAERDAAWPNPPFGAICVTRDTGWSWIRQATAWVPQFASVTGVQTSLGGFPAGAYTYPVSPGPIASLLSANPLFPGGATAWAGFWTIEVVFMSQPSDAGVLTIMVNLSTGLLSTMSSNMAFATAGAIASGLVPAGAVPTWQMYKNPGTTGWTGSNVRAAVTFQPA